MVIGENGENGKTVPVLVEEAKCIDTELVPVHHQDMEEDFVQEVMLKSKDVDYNHAQVLLRLIIKF